jgi:hypothetical protein
MHFTFTAPLWEWEARAAWYFVSVPEEESADIREVPRPPSGFGAVKVRATVGESTWETSIFPGAAEGVYVLPMKKSVRSAEGIEEGEPVTVELELLHQ